MFQNILQNLSTAEGIQNLVILIVVFLFSISFHEYAHGRWAYRLGDDTAQKQGRLTLNPIAHIDPMGTLVLIVSQRIGWAKPVPINPVLFTRAKTMKRGIVEVSLAGPLSNFILSFISYFILNIIVITNWIIVGVNGEADFVIKYIGDMKLITGYSLETNFIVNMFIALFIRMFFLNIFLGIFNLMPIPPLDGFKIFGSLLPDRLYYKFMEYERYIGIVFIFIIIFAGSVFGKFLAIIASPIFLIISKPIELLFNFIARLL
jgi:Zn-dependent protease